MWGQRYHFLVFLFRSLCTIVSLSLFQAEMLKDPEFAKNVKGPEGMLRVRERLGESSRFCVPAPKSGLHIGRRDAGSASVGISGSCGPPLRVSFSGSSARIFLTYLVSALLTVVLTFSLLELQRSLLCSRSRLQLVFFFARMSLTIMPTLLSSATLLKVFRMLGTVFLDPPKGELLFNGQELELLGWP